MSRTINQISVYRCQNMLDNPKMHYCVTVSNCKLNLPKSAYFAYFSKVAAKTAMKLRLKAKLYNIVKK